METRPVAGPCGDDGWLSGVTSIPVGWGIGNGGASAFRPSLTRDDPRIRSRLFFSVELASGEFHSFFVLLFYLLNFR